MANFQLESVKQIQLADCCIELRCQDTKETNAKPLKKLLLLHHCSKLPIPKQTWWENSWKVKKATTCGASIGFKLETKNLQLSNTNHVSTLSTCKQPFRLKTEAKHQAAVPFYAKLSFSANARSAKSRTLGRALIVTSSLLVSSRNFRCSSAKTFESARWLSILEHPGLWHHKRHSRDRPFSATDCSSTAALWPHSDVARRVWQVLECGDAQRWKELTSGSDCDVTVARRAFVECGCDTCKRISRFPLWRMFPQQRTTV